MVWKRLKNRAKNGLLPEHRDYESREENDDSNEQSNNCCNEYSARCDVFGVSSMRVEFWAGEIHVDFDSCIECFSSKNHTGSKNDKYPFEQCNAEINTCHNNEAENHGVNPNIVLSPKHYLYAAPCIRHRLES